MKTKSINIPQMKAISKVQKGFGSIMLSMIVFRWNFIVLTSTEYLFTFAKIQWFWVQLTVRIDKQTLYELHNSPVNINLKLPNQIKTSEPNAISENNSTNGMCVHLFSIPMKVIFICGLCIKIVTNLFCFVEFFQRFDKLNRCE